VVVLFAETAVTIVLMENVMLREDAPQFLNKKLI